jgi:hypothetical protein
MKKPQKPVPQKKINLQVRIRQFNQRWGIVTDDKADFERFRNRVLAVLDETIGEYILSNPGVTRDYAFTLGYNQPPKATLETCQVFSN